MKETQFSSRLVKLFNDFPLIYDFVECEFFKFHSNIYTNGRPDIIGAIEGHPWGIEAKAIDLPKRDTTPVNLLKDLTPIQKAKLTAMQKGSWNTCVVILIRPTNDIAWVPHRLIDCIYINTLKSEFSIKKFPPPHHLFPSNLQQIKDLERKIKLAKK
jgi:hypothetical protein